MANTTVPTIRQLSDAVANQIAAGEVIERPANVVKELVENALDANASHIVVRIEDGGRRLIEIVDNGHGMRSADLAMAVSRHATSKLRNADDLFQVGTLGFRGEALPSIAGVSEFALASRLHDDEGGAQLRIDGSGQHGPESAGISPGTRVTVRNLFWNVPVRLKFLKTAGTETGHVTDMVTRLALGHPQVSFTLECDGRNVLELPAVEELAPRIRSCFGRKVAEGLLPIDGHCDGHQLTGLIAHPSQARPSAKRQFVYLNGRHIRDKLIVAAIREGYRGHLEPRLHPVVFLQLDCDPSLVDVNVHPTKAEVRFRRDREVFPLVRNAINTALEQASGFSLLGGSVSEPAPTETPRQVIKAAHPAPTPSASAEPVIQERYLPHTPDTHVKEAGADYQPSSASGTSPVASGNREPQRAMTADSDQAADLPGVKKIAQLHDMYLLVETDAGIRIIDQHALHEKILYLALNPETADVFGDGIQELLVPITVELSAAEIATLDEHLPRLQACGIQAESFGPTTIAIRSYPSVLKRTNWTKLLTALAEAGPGDDALSTLRESILHRRACRAAVKAGDQLSDAEQLELVRQLLTMDGLEHCPHGRPTTLDLDWGELERRFQR